MLFFQFACPQYQSHHPSSRIRVVEKLPKSSKSLVTTQAVPLSEYSGILHYDTVGRVDELKRVGALHSDGIGAGLQELRGIVRRRHLGLEIVLFK